MLFLYCDLSILKLTKLNLKLYYLPKDIKFSDEKLNFQQDEVTFQFLVQFSQKKYYLFEVLFSDDFIKG